MTGEVHREFRGRREDQRFITGSGRFTSDWDLPGQAHAVFLRSDRAHALIRAIDVSSAREHPGVLGVFTGEDAFAAKLVAPPSLFQEKGRDGRKIINPPNYALATGRVRYVGELVAMVVATSAHGAADALELITVEYDDLPAVVDMDDALEPQSARVHDDIPGNVCLEYEYGDETAVREAFGRAAHVARVTVESQRVAGNPMEPRACLVAWNRVSDSYDVYCSSQGIGLMRGSLSAYTTIPQERIHLRMVDVGGAFGVRVFAYPEYALAMFASRRIDRPVKWVGSRMETILSDLHGRAQRIEGQLALDRDGNFLAVRADLKCDQGAYCSDSGAMVSITNAYYGITGAYRIPHAYGLHRLVMTNTCPIGAYRGAGRPDITYLLEQLVDQAARDMKLDRFQLRRRNFIAADAFPYKTAVGVVYDTADFPGLLDEALHQADWKGFGERQRSAKARGRLLGFGLAAFIERAGGGVPKDQVAIRFDGNRLAVHSVLGPSGQGHETVFPEILGQALGVAPEHIRFIAGDPFGPALVGGGALASRSGFTLGSAMLAGAREVIKRGIQLASEDLEVGSADIEFIDGAFCVKGTDRRVELLQLASKYADKSPHPLDSLGEVSLGATFPSGIHMAEVEIDPETGWAETTRYLAVDDCGRILNPTLLAGQLQGGIVQGAGQVFGEHAHYDRDTGQMLTATFMDYFMPRADLIADLRLVDRSRPTPVNELGAKGAAEAGTTAALAALASGVGEALREGGVEKFELPATPMRVWTALQSAKRSQS